MLAEAAGSDADENERLGDARSRRDRVRRFKEQWSQAEQEASYWANLAD